MDGLPTNSTKRIDNSIDVRYGYYIICSTIIFFQILNKFFAFLGRPDKIHSDDFWRWRNLLCSWTHAFISGSLTLYCVFAYPYMFEDLISFVEPVPYIMIAFSTGYFLYDMVDMIMANELFPNWEVVLHHIAVISLFFYDTAACMCIGYNVLALLAEVNSFFLHTRKLLQMLKTDFNDKFYRLNNIVNLLTFAVFRSISVGSILWGILTPSERQRVSPTYFISLCSAEFVMLIINPVLFVRLVKNDLLRARKPTSVDSSNNNFNKNGHVQNGLATAKRFDLTEKND